MIKIRYVENDDKRAWFDLDKHLTDKEFEHKVYLKQGYVLFKDDQLIGILRFNLFWDSIPFCNMLFIEKNNQHNGYVKLLIKYWEEDMRKQCHQMIMTSTQVDEEAQHFYRKLGYKDCGGMVFDIPGFEQPMELIMSKKL